jgi:hypothetical protein
MHKYKRHTISLASAHKVGSIKKSPAREHAQVRIVILALISFLLGVAATAFWFHLASNRNAENSSSQMSGQQNDEPSAVPVVNANPPKRQFVSSPLPVDPAAIEEVKQAIPNFASVSLADGTQILREAALKQFAAAAKERDIQFKKAQEQLIQAENDQSVADQQAAMKHLQEVQVDQSQKLQHIAGQLQIQIAALQQLKNAK